jgi:hypothetical protein
MKNEIVGNTNNENPGVLKRRLRSFADSDVPFIQPLALSGNNGIAANTHVNVIHAPFGDHTNAAGHWHYDECHSYIGVGAGGDYANINDVGDRTLLGLRGEDPQTQGNARNVCYKAVDGGFPMINGRTITFKAAFYGGNTPAPNTIPDGEGQAAFQWNEWTVARGRFHGTAENDYNNDQNYDKLATGNNANAGCIEHNLNRKVEEMGTKHALATWVITVEISLS